MESTLAPSAVTTADRELMGGGVDLSSLSGTESMVGPLSLCVHYVFIHQIRHHTTIGGIHV